MRHPAKYSDALLPVFHRLLKDRKRVLDPFAGTGKLKEVCPHAVLIEIEPEWAIIGGAVVGNALKLPFPDRTFDAVCTSPTYGNRMADHHNAKDDSRRNTYRHTLGRPLHPENSGAMQWGHKYTCFHVEAWLEVFRTLVPKGIFILNISDHIRKGQVVSVSQWHVRTLRAIGFDLIETVNVHTPRHRFGSNSMFRVEHEHIHVFEKP
jgi:hypothetical protein